MSDYPYAEQDDEELFRFCKDLPKIELHAHLNGSIRTSTIDELCTTKSVPRIVTSNSNGNLRSCFELFGVITKLTTDNDTIYRIAKEMIIDFANENVIYLEIRTGPKNNSQTGMTKRSYIESVIAAIEKSKRSGVNCMAYLMLSVNREETLESAMETVSLAREFPSHVIGIDYSGNPAKGDFDTLLPALEYARKLGLKTAVHFAEVENAIESNKMLDFVPDRLGHAIYMNEQIEKRVLESRIPVEICMTSNVTLASVAAYDKHHFRTLHSRAHPLSLCTDDAGVFATSLTREYFLAASTFHLSKRQLFSLSRDTSNHIFAKQCVPEIENIYATFSSSSKWSSQL